ncbi:MAG: hypothetical protein ACYSSL_10290 [Planctomycetota bacterium]
MELSLLMKFRICAAMGLGVVLIGILAWPLAAPLDPFGVVSVPAGAGPIVLAVLALLTGLLAYFAAWPFGREIGILAVPAGLAVWAIRSNNIANLIQINPTVSQRQELFSAIRWEGVFWLAIVAAGFLGVLLGQVISRAKNITVKNTGKSQPKINVCLSAAIAIIASVIIVWFFIGIFAQDVRVLDSKLGPLVAQPPIGQIVFAVLVSFGIAGFIVKVFLDAGYIWPTTASIFVTAFAVSNYARGGGLEHLAQNWPAVFFPNAASSILPLQMVAFASIGSVAGFWLGIRYMHWRKHGV